MIRKIKLLISGLALGLGTAMMFPIPSLAAEHEVSTWKELKDVIEDDTNETITVNLKNTIIVGEEDYLTTEEGTTIVINGGKDVTLTNAQLNGSGSVVINCKLAGSNIPDKTYGKIYYDALTTSDSVKVIVNQSIINTQGKGGVTATGDSSVTVNGDITSYDGLWAEGNSNVTVYGNIKAVHFGVCAKDNAIVTVRGTVTGGDTTINTAKPTEGFSEPRHGVYAYRSARVFVDGDVVGADAVLPDGNELTNPAEHFDGGYGVEAGDDCTVEVTGNVTGGTSYGTNAPGSYGVVWQYNCRKGNCK